MHRPLDTTDRPAAPRSDARDRDLRRTRCAVLSLAAFGLLGLVPLGLLGPAAAGAQPLEDTSELFNPLLGIRYSHWLTGAIGQIASEDEVAEYLDLLDDEEAREFIDRFWERRAEGTKPFQKTPRQLYEARAEDADKRFSKGTIPGRLTDRGKILVLFGEPERISFETPERADIDPLETWWYSDGAEAGLHGDEPRGRYQFVPKGDRIVLFTGQRLRPDLRERVRSRSFD